MRPASPLRIGEQSHRPPHVFPLIQSGPRFFTAIQITLFLAASAYCFHGGSVRLYIRSLPLTERTWRQPKAGASNGGGGKDSGAESLSRRFGIWRVP